MLGSRYKILSVLGSGGMGVVYRALDLKLDLEIALKRLRQDRLSAEKREALRREIILSRKVTHENVCRIYDLEEIDGVEYVSMEYIRGTALKDIEDKEGVLPLGRGLSIAKGICRGLAAAHKIGVLHRDLKPENVIVDEEGRPRLMDFGIAIDRTQPYREKSSSVPGTPQFLAPELLRGAAPDTRSDLYAVGVLLFEMFTGRVPFDDNDTSVLVRKIIHEEPPDVARLRPDLPDDLVAILKRAIARDPDARFSTADELADAIEAYEGNFLDHILKEVSVVRARSVKLMVILEANKALAATSDPTEILKIILRTATRETDAERGTIFLVEPETRTLVSQVLEGGAMDPIRLPWGQGIAGACAAGKQPILTANVDTDSRHDKKADVTSGFKTRSLLAAPMLTESGEVLGVLELLNKRKKKFTKEDEEFLVTVAEHAAIAVANSRAHAQAVDRAARQTRDRIVRSLRPLLTPATWPDTPGFESAPLRWRAPEINLLGFDIRPGAESTLFALADDNRPFEEGIGDLLATLANLRAAGTTMEPGQLVEKAAAQVAHMAVVRVWKERVEFAGAGQPLPFLFEAGHASPAKITASGRQWSGSAQLAPGDLLFIPSAGAEELFSGGRFPGEMARAAKLAASESLEGIFTSLVSAWKTEGRSPSSRDVVILGVRKL